MKKLIIGLFALLSTAISINAQNTGQGAQNDALHIYFKDSTHVVMKNRLNCTSTVEIKSGSTYTIPAGDSLIVLGTIGFRAKTVQGCGQFDKGWLELDVFLPVGFGKVSAELNDGKLTIKWSTLGEFGNEYFIPQISTNGSIWKDLDKVYSKGIGDYSATMKGTYAIAGIFLLGLGFTKRNYLLMGIAIATIVVSCEKNSDDIKAENVRYVRIKQVDKDGKADYSKVVPVYKN